MIIEKKVEYKLILTEVELNGVYEVLKREIKGPLTVDSKIYDIYRMITDSKK